MKTGKLIAKIVVALAAVAGVVYVVATYGEQIVAWCKKMLETCKCKCCCSCEAEPEAIVEEAEAEVAEEAVAEEVVEAEAPAEEAAVAEDADFEF